MSAFEMPAGWHIEYNPKPIPDRRHDWDYWHDDAETCGTAASKQEAEMAISDEVAA